MDILAATNTEHRNKEGFVSQRKASPKHEKIVKEIGGLMEPVSAHQRGHQKGTTKGGTKQMHMRYDMMAVKVLCKGPLQPYSHNMTMPFPSCVR